MYEVNHHIPKRIWMLWLQGLEDAPLVVKECHRAWKHQNKNWDVIFLDRTTLGQYIDISDVLAKQSKMSEQAVADIIRLRLLTQYGGVWADATSYCQVPLDDWLGDYTETGFFAFGNSRTERLLANWFLVASPGNYLMSHWEQLATSYLINNPHLERRLRIARYFAWLLLKPSTTRFWFSFPIRKVLKMYPYHWPTYLFRELVRTNKTCRALWGQVKFVDSQISQRLYHVGLRSKITPEIAAEIDSRKVPVYKLMWKKSGQNKHLELSPQERTEMDWKAPGVYRQTTREELEGTVLEYLFTATEKAWLRR